MTQTPAPEPALRTAPRALWLVAQAFLIVLHNLFGAPEDVARQHTLTRAAHTLMRQWLRAGEAMMRRLLLIEASAYPKPNTRPLLTPSRKRARKLHAFTPEHPEKWRVSFRCLGADRARPRRPSRRTAPTRFASAWPLAERYEALLRAYNDPAPYARRLAARLFATPHRTRALLHAPPGAAALVGAHDFATLGENAERRKPYFNSA